MWKLFDVDWIRTEYNGKTEAIVVTILFAPIFITGLTGNLWLISTILKRRLPRTSSTIYTLCLALGDLCAFVGLFPILFASQASESSQPSELWCKLSETICQISVTVTALTLIAMSLDRYLAVLSAVTWMQKQVDRKHRAFALATISIIWLISILLALPTSLSARLIHYDLDNGQRVLVCAPGYTFLGKNAAKVLVILKFIVLYMIPIVITSYCYTAVGRKLVWNVKHKKLHYRPAQQHRALRKAQLTVRLAFLLVILFFICFLPHHIVSIWYYTNPSKLYGLSWRTARITAFMFTFINSLLNPIIICSTSCHLKKMIKKKLIFLRNI